MNRWDRVCIGRVVTMGVYHLVSDTGRALELVNRKRKSPKPREAGLPQKHAS